MMYNKAKEILRQKVKMLVISIFVLCFKVLSECWAILKEIPSKCLGDVTPMSDVKTEAGDRILIATSQDGSHLVMHVYKHGLVTMDIQFVGQEPLEDDMIDKLEFVNIKRIEDEIKSVFGDKCKYARIFPARMKRGEICPYFLTGDSRLVESRNPLKLLAEKESKWQNIKIYETKEFGAMLNLDGEFHLWDAEDLYYPTLLGTSRHSYKDKTVLVLGGAGGGILSELLKLSPKNVILVEISFRANINIEVFNMCREYLKCGVQELEGPNYKILIEDCQKTLKDYRDAGMKFDFVVNDLGEELLNVDEEAYEETESDVLTASMKVLAPNGTYLSRGAVLSEWDTLELVERGITNHKPALTFKQFREYIPVFDEQYCFYEVKRENEHTP